MRSRGVLGTVRAGAAWLGWGLLAGGLTGLALRPGAPPAAVEGAGQDNLPPARHEESDVGVPAMLTAGVLMLVALVGMLGAAAWLYPGSRTDKRLTAPKESEFPAPRLQPDPPADMARFRAEQLQQLNGAYWLDRERGRVHMPIADAMRDVAARGIPDWPSAPAWVRR